MNEIIKPVPLQYCTECGKIRGDLSMLCADCLSERFGDGLAHDQSDRYRMQDTVREGDRERMDSVRASFRRGYD